MYMMLGRAILSWFVRDLSNPIVKFLYEVTEPMVAPVRNVMQKMGLTGGMFDFSFLVTYLLLLVMSDLVGMIFFR
jgi:YggT family protein